jgi:hypothetical protein
MKRLCLLAMVLTSFAAILPASADGGQGTGLYNQHYGGGRVCKMHQNGLIGDVGRSTYVGVGTMSQTAQGKNPAFNPNLPSTSWGGTIRTPGDTLYNGSNTVREANGAVNYKDNVYRNEMRKQAVAESRAYQNWLRSGGAQRAQRQYEMQNGNYYQPGSNGGAAGYSAGSGGNYRYNNGMASYGSYGR